MILIICNQWNETRVLIVEKSRTLNFNNYGVVEGIYSHAELQWYKDCERVCAYISKQ